VANTATTTAAPTTVPPTTITTISAPSAASQIVVVRIAFAGVLGLVARRRHPEDCWVSLGRG
jgi:hypothetical protein